MTPEQFAYWLQGGLELGNKQYMTQYEIEIVKKHLKTVVGEKESQPKPQPKRTVDLSRFGISDGEDFPILLLEDKESEY
jgi:hypothetical protein